MDLENKIAVVTGGTRGIGMATVKAFLAEGATVILCGSRQETAEKALAALKEADPQVKADCIWPDLTNLSSVQAAFDGVVAKYGRIDVLVNNAGVSDATPIDAYTEENFRRVMDLNVMGAFNCTRAVETQMKKQGSGVVLNTSSMVSISGSPSGVAYPTSKFAVNGMTLSLARELGPFGIRVCAVAPGVTDTDMMRAVPQKYIDAIVANIPLRRIGKPEEVANAFVFLASDKASYITGVVLSVDGLSRN